LQLGILPWVNAHCENNAGDLLNVTKTNKNSKRRDHALIFSSREGKGGNWQKPEGRDIRKDVKSAHQRVTVGTDIKNRGRQGAQDESLIGGREFTCKGRGYEEHRPWWFPKRSHFKLLGVKKGSRQRKETGRGGKGDTGREENSGKEGVLEKMGKKNLGLVELQGRLVQVKVTSKKRRMGQRFAQDEE